MSVGGGHVQEALLFGQDIRGRTAVGADDPAQAYAHVAMSLAVAVLADRVSLAHLP